MIAVKYRNTSAELPDDPLVLKARIRKLGSLLLNSELRCSKLDYKLQSVLDRLYGSKADALSPAQKLLFGLLDAPIAAEPAQAAPPSITPAATTASTTRAKKAGRPRHRKVPFPDNLPEKRETIDLSDEQKKGLVKIREEITRQIDFEPGHFFWRVIVRPVYAHPQRQHAPRVMPLPPQVIPQSNLATGFIAQVVVSRFADAVPSYRQEGIDARSGIVISRPPVQAVCVVS